jgi:CBS domain-containing protein
MSTVREIMTGHAECIGENETLEAAARKMVQLDVGSLPICGQDQRLKGMLTDRDIVAKCVALGNDPRNTLARDLAQGKPVVVGPDDSVDKAIALMEEHMIRRLPVVDEHRLVGFLSQADIALCYTKDKVGELVEVISHHR